MKVLHLYAGNLFGGVETFLLTLARLRHLCPAMEPHFGLCFEGRLAEGLRSTGSPVHSFGQVRLGRPWTVARARQRLRQLLLQQRFDVVICHSCWVQVVLGPTVRQQGLPLVFWCHDIPQGRHWLERLAAQIPPDLAIANSQYTLTHLPVLYPRGWREVCYLPVEPVAGYDRTEVRAGWGLPQEQVVILQASRMEAWKGQGLLLEALGQLQALPQWVCWIAGGRQRPQEEAYWHQLQTQVQQLGLSDRVQFLGQRSDIPQLLAAADLYCQPNLAPEPFGIAFVEALSAGVPVVTTAMGGGQEIVNSSCGRLVTPNDVGELTRHLQELILNKHLRQQLGRAGPQRAISLCHPPQQFNQLYTLLTSFLQQKLA